MLTVPGWFSLNYILNSSIGWLVKIRV